MEALKDKYPNIKMSVQHVKHQTPKPPKSTNMKKDEKPKDMSLLQKFLLVNALMNSMNKMFGGQNGISPVPSVHPVLDDQASTTEVARGKEEREQHAVPKSKDKTAKPNTAKIPKKQNFKVTDPGGEPASTASKSQIAALAEASKGGAVDDAGNLVDIPGPKPTIIQGADLPEQLGAQDATPSQDSIDDNLRSAEDIQKTQEEIAAAGAATVLTPEGTGISSEEIYKASEALRSATDETVKEDPFMGSSSDPEAVDAAVRNLVMQQNFDPKAVEDTIYNAYVAPEKQNPTAALAARTRPLDDAGNMT